METGLTTVAVLATQAIIIGLVVWSHLLLRRFIQIEFRRDTDRKERRAARSQSIGQVPELGQDLVRSIIEGDQADGSI